MNQLTQQGIVAFKAGDKDLAFALLKKALQENRNDVEAWLWLSGVVKSDQERLLCLQNALHIDPGNQHARRAFNQIQTQLLNPVQNQSTAGKIHPFTQIKSELNESPPLADIETAKPFQSSPPFLDSAQLSESTTSIPEAASQSFLPVTSHSEFQEDGEKLQTPAILSSEKVASAPAKRPRKGCVWYVVGSFLLLIALLITGILIYLPQFKIINSQISEIPVLPEQAAGPVINQVIHSSTKTPAITPTKMEKPTLTPTPLPTFRPLGPTIDLQIDKIDLQVSDLRGLFAKTSVPVHIMTQLEAKNYLSALLVNDQLRSSLENKQRTLSTLGLLDPSYNLVDISLNHLVDNIGGLYISSRNEIYILGLRFGGIEHFAYSHEFDHAIVDQNYDMRKLGISPQCSYDDQHCQAVTALVEGDATFLMLQWLQKYAAPEDYRDFKSYVPPLLPLGADQQPPPYLQEDVNFSYKQGLAFVQAIYDRGKWEAVNQVYDDPPTTTEQILHSEKYFKKEVSMPVEIPALEQGLGGDWKMIENNVLGEWDTYLVLAYPANSKIPTDLKAANKAAAGWGGDRYKVYYSPGENKTALAVQWAWDSVEDAQEFDQVLSAQLNQRFNAAKIDHPTGNCWQTNDQSTCMITHGKQTLWLLAPKMEQVNAMLADIPEFKR
jgi:hypothetical protein